MKLRVSCSGFNQLDLGYRAEGLGFARCSRYGRLQYTSMVSTLIPEA